MSGNFLKRALGPLSNAWERFWFAPVSVSPLAVFRILFGMLLIQYALLLMPDLYVWLGKDGIVPSTVVNGWQHNIRLNILNLFPDSDLWLNIVFALFIISAIALTIGFKTRLSSILVFICLASLHARNYLILNSGDVFMRMLCFWLIFSAAGMSLSVDRVLSKRRRKKDNAFTDGQDDIVTTAPWAQRLMQINMSLLYLQAFTKKITGSDWQSGMAVYFSSRMVEMHRLPVYFLFDHVWICRLLSWAVLGIEFSLATLIWVRPLRYYVLIMGVIMHLFIDWTMNIPQFEWIMMVNYLLFVEPADMDKFLDRMRQLFLKLAKKFNFSQALL